MTKGGGGGTKLQQSQRLYTVLQYHLLNQPNRSRTISSHKPEHCSAPAAPKLQCSVQIHICWQSRPGPAMVKTGRTPPHLFRSVAGVPTLGGEPLFTGKSPSHIIHKWQLCRGTEYSVSKMQSVVVGRASCMDGAFSLGWKYRVLTCQSDDATEGQDRHEEDCEAQCLDR